MPRVLRSVRKTRRADRRRAQRLIRAAARVCEHPRASSGPRLEFCPVRLDMSGAPSELPDDAAISSESGDGNHRAGGAKLQPRARTHLLVCTNIVRPRELAADDVDELTGSEIEALASAGNKRDLGGRPKGGKCRKCSRKGKGCGPACEEWPGHAAVSIAAASPTTAASAAATTADHTSSAAGTTARCAAVARTVWNQHIRNASPPPAPSACR